MLDFRAAQPSTALKHCGACNFMAYRRESHVFVEQVRMMLVRLVTTAGQAKETSLASTLTFRGITSAVTLGGGDVMSGTSKAAQNCRSCMTPILLRHCSERYERPAKQLSSHDVKFWMRYLQTNEASIVLVSLRILMQFYHA